MRAVRGLTKAMIKFDRNYRLRVQTELGGSFLDITLPFTIEFDITRNVLTSANICQVRVYNLSEDNRDLIRHNAHDIGNYKRLILEAGYGDNLAVIFKGNIRQAWSVREGTNFITQMECYDGGFAFVNGVVNLQVPSGTTRKAELIAVATAGLPHVSVGAVGTLDGPPLTRSNVHSGNTVDVLRQLTAGGAFIDQERFNFLGTNEYIQSLSGDAVIDSRSGLLGTPILEQNKITFDMLLEPGLNPGHRVFLDSDTGAAFDGAHIIKGVKHRGMISAAVCGNAITTGTFLFIKQIRGVTSVQ